LRGVIRAGEGLYSTLKDLNLTMLSNWTLDKIPMAMRFPLLKKEKAVAVVVLFKSPKARRRPRRDGHCH
jgi:hypothetical protein